MITATGNNYAAGIFARPKEARPAEATFDTFLSGPSSEVGQAVHAPTVQKAGSASSSVDGTQPDFTSMTRRDLRDWANDQIKSEKMSFDDGSALFLMSGKVRMDGKMDIEADSKETVDFVGLAQDGIAGAVSRHDQAAVDRLQMALTIMGRSQKDTETDLTSTAESSLKLKEALAAFEKEALPTRAVDMA